MKTIAIINKSHGIVSVREREGGVNMTFTYTVAMHIHTTHMCKFTFIEVGGCDDSLFSNYRVHVDHHHTTR